MPRRLTHFAPAPLTAALFLVAGGCASLNPKPDIDRAAATVRERSGYAADWTAPWSDRFEAWDGAAPLAADQAIVTALKNNRRIRADVESIAAGRADLVQAGLLPNPVVSLTLRFPFDPVSGGSFVGSFRDGLEDARDAIQTAARMRAGCLVVYTGARGGHTDNHARRLLKEALKELLPQAAEQGVTLALEPMHAEVTSECTFLNDLTDAVSLIETLGHPRLKLAFHTYHMGLCPAWKTNLAAVAPHIALVHLGDGHPPREGEQVRTKLGDGVVPLAEIIASVGSAGFDGYYDVELIGTEVEPGGYLDLLKHSREAFTKLAL